MRIGDWSSDVCSSDLLRRGAKVGRKARRLDVHPMADEAAAAIDRRTLFRERRVGPVLGIRDRLGLIARGGRQRTCLSVQHEGQAAAGLGATLATNARALFAAAGRAFSWERVGNNI